MREDTPQHLQIHGYLAHKKPPPPLGPPSGPTDSPTVGSYGEAVSYGRGTPVQSLRLTAIPLQGYLGHKKLPPPRTLQ